jgi:hypothetical protein
MLGLPFSRRMTAVGFVALGAVWAAEHGIGMTVPDVVRFGSGSGLGVVMAAAMSPPRAARKRKETPPIDGASNE